MGFWVGEVFKAGEVKARAYNFFWAVWEVGRVKGLWYNLFFFCFFGGGGGFMNFAIFWGGWGFWGVFVGGFSWGGWGPLLEEAQTLPPPPSPLSRGGQFFGGTDPFW